MEETREERLENGFSNAAVSPDEPKSEPLPETPSLLPADGQAPRKSILRRQRSLVILTGNPGGAASAPRVASPLIARRSFLRASAGRLAHFHSEDSGDSSGPRGAGERRGSRHY